MQLLRFFPRMCFWRRLSSFLPLLFFGLSSVEGAGTEFRGLGFFTGGDASAAKSISADGRVIVGDATLGNGQRRPFRYLASQRVLEKLNITADSDSGDIEAAGVSSDGRLIAGTDKTRFLATPFVWDGTGGSAPIVKFPPSPTFNNAAAEGARAFAISGSGSIFVGESVDPVSGVPHACRWTRNALTGEYVPAILPNEFGGNGFAIGSALAIGGPANNPIIGGHQLIFSGRHAIRFANGTATQVTPDNAVGENGVRGVSTDGSTLVGTSGPTAARFIAGTVQDLGDFSGGAVESQANDVSADGLRIVGFGTVATGRQAFIWDPNTGLRSIRQLLVDAGVNVTGWTLTEATGISDDGTTVVGIGTNPAGKTEGWMAVLSTPPVITTPTTTKSEAGRPFRLQIQATGNPTSFAATNLPATLQLNSSNGLITGTTPPRIGGPYVITVSAAGANGTGSTTITLTSIDPPNLEIPGPLAGSIELPFNYQIREREGTGFKLPTSVLSATGLPAGLSMSESGLISGTPREEGTFSLAIQASNGFSTQNGLINLTIGPPALGFSSDLAASGEQGRPFSYQVVATTNPSSYGASNLPSGLSINRTTGLITGTPAATGIFPATIIATNPAGTGNFILTIAIGPAGANPNEPVVENIYGHGLKITSITSTGVWASGNPDLPTYAGSVTVTNPSATASFSGQVDLFYYIGESRFYFPSAPKTFVNIPAGSAVTLTYVQDVVPEAPPPVLYARVAESVPGRGIIESDTGIFVNFVTYPTGPPSGGVSQTDSGLAAPDFQPPVTLADVAISGPVQVNENSSANYSARAIMQDGSVRNVSVTSWTSSLASINAAGLFTPGAVTGNSAATVRATLSVSGVSRTGLKRVTVVDLTPKVTVTAPDPIASRTNSSDTGTFRISRTGSTAGSLTVTYQLSGDATEGRHFASINSRQAVIPAGSASVDITITPLNNGQLEPNRTVTLTAVSPPGGGTYTTGTSAQASVTIIGSVAFQFGAANYSVREEAGSLEIPVLRSGDTGPQATVSYSVAGTGRAGIDFVLSPGTITFATGETEKRLVLQVLNNTTAGVARTVQLTLSTPSPGASLGAPLKTTVTIVDDELSNFSPFAASYYGLVRGNSPSTSAATSGFIRVTVSASGVFSGALRLDDDAFSFIGRLNGQGALSSPLPLGRTGRQLTLALDVTGGRKITGSILEGGSPVATFTTNSPFFHRTTNPAPSAVQGAFTILLPPGDTVTQSPSPGGSGYGAATVDASGWAAFRVVLGDGTTGTVTLPLTEDLSCPFYIFSSTHGDIALGTVSFRARTESDFDSTIDWFKAARTTASFYPQGFSTQVELLGSRYITPTIGRNAFNESGAGTAILRIGTLPEQNITLPTLTTNVSSPVIVGENRLRLAISTTTGLYVGTFAEPLSQKSRMFTGALFQKTKQGGGLIKGLDRLTAPVELAPP